MTPARQVALNMQLLACLLFTAVVWGGIGFMLWWAL